jgi:hypothetical protein
MIVHKLLQSFHDGVFSRVHEISVNEEIMKVLERDREIYSYFLHFFPIAQSQETKTHQDSDSENKYGVCLSGKNMPA